MTLLNDFLNLASSERTKVKPGTCRPSIPVLIINASCQLPTIAHATAAASAACPTGTPRQVRGAPLIAMVAVLGLSVDALTGSWEKGTAEDVSKILHEK